MQFMLLLNIFTFDSKTLVLPDRSFLSFRKFKLRCLDWSLETYPSAVFNTNDFFRVIETIYNSSCVQFDSCCWLSLYRCIEGYYGDPRIGVDIPCRPCPCPETVESGHSYATRCALDARTQDVVCECSVGYAGKWSLWNLFIIVYEYNV